jgi:hypothetical protein
MTKEADPTGRADETGDDAEEQRVRSILRRARIVRAPDVDLLRGVQRRIRERSRGRFYGDGWSRSRATTTTYVVTSLLMLVILALVYFVLVPEFKF